MGTGVYFTIEALLYIILLIIIFFNKRRLKSEENEIYSSLIFITFLELVLELTLDLVGPLYKESPFVSMFVAKFYCLFLTFWNCYICTYISIITLKMKNKANLVKKAKNILLGIAIILGLGSIVLPLKFHYETNVAYTYGPSVMCSYISGTIYIVISTILLLINYKKIKDKRFIPIIVLVTFGTLCTAIQSSNPNLLLTTPLHTFITFMMYFTIENPDLQMVDELIKNKQLVESAFEDKSVYLFKMTQQVREPVDKINHLVKEYKEIDNEEDKQLIIEKLENYSKNLNFMINNVMDVSSIDVNNIKLFNTTYSPHKFFLDIKKKTQQKIKQNPNLNLYFDINRTLPDELYGDPVKLKQVMMSLIENAVKYTDKGMIDINVDGITRYDTCRLVITIKDTGRGMHLEDVNEILVSNNDLSKEEIEKLDKLDVDLRPSLKIIKLLGGIVNIKSEVNTGTELTIVLDQKVNFSEENKFLQNISSQVGNTRVLIVDNDNKEINKIVRMLSKRDINTSVAMYGQECVDKIRIGEKYNLIIMDDEMKPDNALPTLQKLKELKKFNIPVIVMLEKEKDFIKKHYLKDGFTDYILKDNLDKELDRIVNKYL